MKSQDDRTILVLSQEEDVKCVFEGTWARVVSTGGVFCVLSLSVAFPYKAAIVLADRKQ